MCWIYCPDQGIDTMLVCTELSPQNVTKVAWTGTQDDSMSFDNMAKVTSTTLISTTKSSKPSVPAKCSSSLNDGGSLCISSRSRSTSDRSSHLPQVGDTSCSSALLRPDWDQTQLNCLNPWPQMWIVSIWVFCRVNRVSDLVSPIVYTVIIKNDQQLVTFYYYYEITGP